MWNLSYLEQQSMNDKFIKFHLLYSFIYLYIVVVGPVYYYFVTSWYEVIEFKPNSVRRGFVSTSHFVEKLSKNNYCLYEVCHFMTHFYGIVSAKRHTHLESFHIIFTHFFISILSLLIYKYTHSLAGQTDITALLMRRFNNCPPNNSRINNLGS